jgi:flagellar hook assembly protein FlgD
VDDSAGIVSLMSAHPLGRYQVRNVLRATDFTISQMTPRKIFTPNGDGVNDEITLYLENPKDSVLTQAKIFDITGAEVADFQQGVVAGASSITSLKWDGRDKTGSTVRSGVYVYQVQAEGKILNGTIVVAR